MKNPIWNDRLRRPIRNHVLQHVWANELLCVDPRVFLEEVGGASPWWPCRWSKIGYSQSDFRSWNAILLIYRYFIGSGIGTDSGPDWVYVSEKRLCFWKKKNNQCDNYSSLWCNLRWYRWVQPSSNPVSSLSPNREPAPGSNVDDRACNH